MLTEVAPSTILFYFCVLDLTSLTQLSALPTGDVHTQLPTRSVTRQKPASSFHILFPEKTGLLLGEIPMKHYRSQKAVLNGSSKSHRHHPLTWSPKTWSPPFKQFSVWIILGVGFGWVFFGGMGVKGVSVGCLFVCLFSPISSKENCITLFRNPLKINSSYPQKLLSHV